LGIAARRGRGVGFGAERPHGGAPARLPSGIGSCGWGKAAVTEIVPSSVFPDMPASITERYAALVEAGAIERDAAQIAVVARLAALAETVAARRLGRKSSALGWLLGGRQATNEPPKGLY